MTRRKLARDATPDEIFPGPHGPLQANIADVLPRVMDELRRVFSGYELTLFVAEPTGIGSAEARLPRFNYISTAARPDMLAVLKAFVAKNEAEAPKLDRIEDAPPTETRQ